MFSMMTDLLLILGLLVLLFTFSFGSYLMIHNCCPQAGASAHIATPMIQQSLAAAANSALYAQATVNGAHG